MPELIDKQQLQATAQVAKSYILEQDTNNVNTIINALQSSSGSSQPAAKTEPTLIIDTGFGGNGSYTYNGDGDIFGYVEGYFLNIDRNDKTFTVIGHDDYTPYVDVFDYTITLYASETANFAAKSVSATFSSQPDTPVAPDTPGI